MMESVRSVAILIESIQKIESKAKLLIWRSVARFIDNRDA
jgi:hypothetical protein